MKKIILTFALVLGICFSSSATIIIKNYGLSPSYNLEVYYNDNTTASISWNQNSKTVEVWNNSRLLESYYSETGNYSGYSITADNAHSFWANFTGDYYTPIYLTHDGNVTYSPTYYDGTVDSGIIDLEVFEDY